MSEEWKPGDLALCIKGGKLTTHIYPTPLEYPVTGRIYTVDAIECVEFITGWHLALNLKDGPMNYSGDRRWRAHRFVKVTPQKEDMFDREIINHMLLGSDISVDGVDV